MDILKFPLMLEKSLHFNYFGEKTLFFSNLQYETESKICPFFKLCYITQKVLELHICNFTHIKPKVLASFGPNRVEKQLVFRKICAKVFTCNMKPKGLYSHLIDKHFLPLVLMKGLHLFV